MVSRENPAMPIARATSTRVNPGESMCELESVEHELANGFIAGEQG